MRQQGAFSVHVILKVVIVDTTPHDPNRPNEPRNRNRNRDPNRNRNRNVTNKHWHQTTPLQSHDTTPDTPPLPLYDHTIPRIRREPHARFVFPSASCERRSTLRLHLTWEGRRKQLKRSRSRIRARSYRGAKISCTASVKSRRIKAGVIKRGNRNKSTVIHKKESIAKAVFKKSKQTEADLMCRDVACAKPLQTEVVHKAWEEHQRQTQSLTTHKHTVLQDLLCRAFNVWLASGHLAQHNLKVVSAQVA